LREKNFNSYKFTISQNDQHTITYSRKDSTYLLYNTNKTLVSTSASGTYTYNLTTGTYYLVILDGYTTTNVISSLSVLGTNSEYDDIPKENNSDINSSSDVYSEVVVIWKIEIIITGILAGAEISYNMIVFGYDFTTAAGAYVLDMKTDSNGIYHAKFDCWQAVWGYNDLYNFFFNIATSMQSVKFEFKSDTKDYMIWAWKGDYINLGAGAEMGIYHQPTNFGLGHWYSDKKDAMKMSLTLQHTDPSTKKTTTVFTYNPSDKQWWITGFNPNKKNVKANELTAIYTITFNNSTMYNDFYNKYGDKNKNTYDPRWSFNGNQTAIFTF